MLSIEKLDQVKIDHTKLRELRGTETQAEIADKIGVSSNQISNIEQGIRNPSAAGLLRLMLLYQVRAEDIALIE